MLQTRIQTGGQPVCPEIAGPIVTPARARPVHQRCQRAAWPPRHGYQQVACSAVAARGSVGGFLSDVDCQQLIAAAQLSQSAVGVTQPHPNAACILVGPDGRPLATAYQRAQGTTSSEVLAVSATGGAARGATAYLNMESGDCHGEAAAVDALVRSGVSRVVVGMRHPLPHLRSKAIGMLRASGVRVDVLSDTVRLVGGGSGSPEVEQERAAALSACFTANEALLHRAALRRPLSVLKYAMTLDGKIATSMGHSAWVSSAQSRALVFEQRARSDAVIVGGNTVRRDDPRLTTRQEGGHTPVRVVMSRTLDLPEDANLWDVTLAPTIVMTQRGARQRFQAALRARGVEVVEFDFLTPESVADYCYERGFLQCFWECGGTLAAPTISSGVIHKLMAFVAPKIIGGIRAPTPVGELGFVEMTQAVDLVDTEWRQVGPDLMITGYMPSSGGLTALEATLAVDDDDAALGPAAATAAGPGTSVRLPGSGGGPGGGAAASSSGALKPANGAGGASSSSSDGGSSIAAKRRRGPGGSHGRAVSFYKAWDQWGSLSNFSPHPISLPVEPSSTSTSDNGASSNGNGVAPAMRTWASVEHYYQAHKFSGGHHPEAAAVMEAISAAPSPEEAARIGRRTERLRPELMRRDWGGAKLGFMRAALRAKFSQHPGPRAMLLATAGVAPTAAATELIGAVAAAAAAAAAVAVSAGASAEAVGRAAMSMAATGQGSAAGAVAVLSPPAGAAESSAALSCLELVEASPHDYYWGAGFERTGQNKLGQLLMEVRGELLADVAADVGCRTDNAWQRGGSAEATAAALHAHSQSARG